MPLSKRGRRKAKKAKAIELTLTDPSIARSYERKVERLLGKVHEDPPIFYSWSVQKTYPWSLKKATNDEEEDKEDSKEYISDSGECPVFFTQDPEEPIAESFIEVLIRFIDVLIRFIASKITNITMGQPTIEKPTIEEPTIEEPTIEEPTIEKPEGLVLVRFIMIGFETGANPRNDPMKLGFGMAQEMMEKICSDFELDYEKSSMLGPKVVMLPFHAQHENHVSWLTENYLKTISTYDDIMVESSKKDEIKTTHVFGIEVFIVNTKNKIAMQYYDNAKTMARIIPYNDDSIQRFKNGMPDAWAKIPVIPFFDLYEAGAVNSPMHIDI